MLEINQIKEHLNSFGLLPDDIIFDGEIHRVPTIEKPNKLKGWYIVLDKTIVFGDWLTGQKETLSLKTGHSKLSKADISQLIKNSKNKQREKQKEQLKAKVKALDIYNASAEPPLNHPYLLKKNILPLGFGYETASNNLIVPIVDIETREIWNIQRIFPNGDKRFFTSGAIKGMCYVALSNGKYVKDREQVFICEGVATALSIHQYNDSAVLAALNAGNLKSVAIKARMLWPSLDIVICADNDYKTEKEKGKNPGLEKATEAADLINASVSVPPFTQSQLNSGLTDWNDFLTTLEAVA